MGDQEVMENAVHVKDYKVQERAGYKFIGLPKTTATGKVFEVWQFPDGRILLKPVEDKDVS